MPGNNPSSEELDALRTAAEAACAGFAPRQRRGVFAWRGEHYVVRRSYLRTFVETLDGVPLTHALNELDPRHRRLHHR